MREITVPTLNANDVEYVLVEWLAPAGQPVTAGQPVALVETSKAAQELPAGSDGVLEPGLPPGSRCRPGTVIGWVLGSGERRPARPGGPADPSRGAHGDLQGLVLTDSARALIAEHNVPEEQVRAIGKRVVRGADVMNLLAPGLAPGPAPAATSRAGAAPASAGPENAGLENAGPENAGPKAETLSLSRVQRAVAATVTAALDVPAAFTLVKIYLDGPGDHRDVPELVISTTAAQRKRYPAFFARLTGRGTLAVSPGAHIAVTVDTGHGLYLPVLHDAASLSLAEISAALLRFRVQARRGRFNAAELAGGNIGITLHTESAVVLAQPIIHPGHTCALAVCATLEEYRQAPDGSAGSRSYFHLGIAYDHRVINGRDATLFLDAIKRSIETAGQAGTIR